MELTLAQQSAIRTALEYWLRNPHIPDPELSAIARRLGALPVYGDMGGILLVRPDGEVLGLGDQYDEGALVDVEPGWVVVAYLAAAKRHPTLDFLRPARPVTAIDCSLCSGAGSVDLGFEPRIGCGRCWGLGWVEG